MSEKASTLPVEYDNSTAVSIQTPTLNIVASSQMGIEDLSTASVDEARKTAVSDKGSSQSPTVNIVASSQMDIEDLIRASVDEARKILPIPINSHFLPDIAWEGEVKEVFEDYFSARLVDTINPSNVELTQIYKTSVTDQYDLELVKPGAIFFWTIGHRVARHRVEHVSQIMFRRLPVWSGDEVDKAMKHAEESKEILGW